MRMNLPKVKMLQVSKCLIGLAVMMLQSCDVADNRRDMLCGNWESVEGKPAVPPAALNKSSSLGTRLFG